MDKNPTYWQADEIAIEHLVLPATNTQLDTVTRGYDWAYSFISDVKGTWGAASRTTVVVPGRRRDRPHPEPDEGAVRRRQRAQGHLLRTRPRRHRRDRLRGQPQRRGSDRADPAEPGAVPRPVDPGQGHDHAGHRPCPRRVREVRLRAAGRQARQGRQAARDRPDDRERLLGLAPCRTAGAARPREDRREGADPGTAARRLPAEHQQREVRHGDGRHGERRRVPGLQLPAVERLLPAGRQVDGEQLRAVPERRHPEAPRRVPRDDRPCRAAAHPQPAAGDRVRRPARDRHVLRRPLGPVQHRQVRRVAERGGPVHGAAELRLGSAAHLHEAPTP